MLEFLSMAVACCFTTFVLLFALKQEIRKKPATPVPYNRYDQERFRGKEGAML